MTDDNLVTKLMLENDHKRQKALDRQFRLGYQAHKNGEARSAPCRKAEYSFHWLQGWDSSKAEAVYAERKKQVT